MATNRPTGDLVEIIAQHSKDIRRLKQRLASQRTRPEFGDNLILNAGLEAETIRPHIVFDDGGGQATWSIDSAEARSGDQCLSVDCTGMTTGNTTRFMLRGIEHVPKFHIPTQAGERYWFNIWAKSASGSTPNSVRTRCEFWNSNGHQGGAGTSAWTAPGSTYEKIGNETSEVPNGIEWIVFDIEVRQDDATEQELFLDDFYVTLSDF